ncbi:hypothetical protein [Crassaminicella thermophila]|nr:hypothetical protein [Crassaminicella thermophila]
MHSFWPKAIKDLFKFQKDNVFDEELIIGIYDNFTNTDNDISYEYFLEY